MELNSELHFQFEFIRRGGKCNMMDRYCVQGFADLNEFYNLAEICDEGKTYSKLLSDYKQVDEALYQLWLEDRHNFSLDDDDDDVIFD